MKFSINKTLSVAIAMVILTISLVLFISIRKSKQLNNKTAAVSHIEKILGHLQQLIFAVLENEAGARSYTIAGGNQFFEHISRSGDQMQGELLQLKELVKYKKAQLLLNDSLTFYVAKRANFSNRLVSTYREKGQIAATTLLSTAEGDYYTQRIRSASEEIRQEENKLLETTSNNNDAALRKLNTFFYSVLAAGFILSILTLQSMRPGIRKQKLNEQKFSALLDAAPDATVIVNEKGLIQMVNQQVENLFGYKQKEIIGKPVEILMPQELRNRHVNHRNEFIKEARIRSMGAGIELNAVKKNGDAFPVEISLSPIKIKEGLLISASIRDITDRKKSEQKFRSLLDAAPDATVIVNEKGIIIMANNQTENLFEYSRDELVGQSVEILIPKELHDKHTKHRQDFFKIPKVRTMGAGIELNAVKKNGKKFPVEISLSPIQTEEGVLVSASVRDISSRKMLENELKKSNAELEAFTYSVSHDLRAPLRGITGLTTILEEDYAGKLDDEGRQLTYGIRENTLRMANLIDDLLAFSRMGKQELIKTNISMKALVDEVVKQNQAPKIKWDIRTLSPVKADKNTIRQVWVNLISNAIKYSGHKENQCIEIGSFFRDGYNVFYVKDNGVGFDEKYKHKLFKVFQRLHDAEVFEGTGVGLALVERIVSKHGGEVWAEGQEDKGACFYFSLPV